MWQLPESIREIEEAGEDGLVLELIDSFDDDTAKRFKRLRHAVGRLDAVALKAEAHAIRGSARQMGADQLAELCLALETVTPALECQVNQAEELFAQVRSDMSDYVKAKGRVS